MSANVMRTLESGVTQPERGRRDMGRQAKFSFGQSRVSGRLGANHGGYQVVQPKRIMGQRTAQPLAGDTVISGESLRATSGEKENKTGLPDRLKAGVENLSGYSMDDVRVHYNSEKPAQLQALAYTQGTEIHVGPGQEKHLAHEAWHVVQQKEGRVKPTKQMKGKVNVNDDAGLEKEADLMGAKAIQLSISGNKTEGDRVHKFPLNPEERALSPVIQLSSHSINGILINAETIKKVNQEVESAVLNISSNEKAVLNNLTNNSPTSLEQANRTQPNAVVNNLMIFQNYMELINQQETGNLNFNDAISSVLKFIKTDLKRTYAGIRLDSSGTTFKLVHYGQDEEIHNRTDLEERTEPLIESSLLNNDANEISKILDKLSYLKTLKKMGINFKMSDNEINNKLKMYDKKVKTGGDESHNAAAIKSQENTLRESEKLLVTHKGIFKSFSLEGEEKELANIKDDFPGKYSINNFGSTPAGSQVSEVNKKQIQEFWERVKNDQGKILLWGYAIAGFGDLGNFQMLYRHLVEQSKIKERLEPYVCFYRYSIADNIIDRLLDPDIKVITHENVNRQWDPNYGYKVSQAVMPKVDFEIQYNVGSVFNTAPKENVLRVGEMGGMAGVSQVKNAFFTGITRGGVGYGIPSQRNPEKDQNIIHFALSLHKKVTNQNPEVNNMTSIIKNQYGLMMARENSQIVNQRRYYNNNEIDKADLRNISVGTRVLALILKGMLNQTQATKPVIITTANIDVLIDAGNSIDLTINNNKKSIKVDNKEGEYLVYEVESDNKKGYIVKGFFDNNYIHLLMKYAKTPTVYSGEGAMNEGLSYGTPGFMIPFYDFQVTLLLESGGIENQTEIVAGYGLDQSQRTIWMNQADYKSNIQEKNLLKLALDSDPESLYLVITRSNQAVKIRKLDKPDEEFNIKPSTNQYAKPRKLTAYKLKPWAQEWMKLIYGRDQNNINVEELGKQSQEIAGNNNNWFDLLR
ncbi:MAG: DUF4157 domain-containing protein [Moorea sp. SIO3G5]|nr:DUF4157 domain-containing protein [Moorena sp. SIO3G5]